MRAALYVDRLYCSGKSGDGILRLLEQLISHIAGWMRRCLLCNLDAGPVPALLCPPLHLLACRRRVGILPCMTCGSRPTLAAPAPMPASRGTSETHIHNLSYSTGSRAPAPTAASPDARFQRPGDTSIDFTGSRAPAPTLAPPGARPKRPLHKWPPPTGTRAPARVTRYAGSISRMTMNPVILSR